MKGFTVTDKNWCVCVCLCAHECKRVYMRTLLFIYLFIYKNDRLCKSWGHRKEGGGSHYPIQFFFCVSIYCVRKRVWGTNMCTTTRCCVYCRLIMCVSMKGGWDFVK